MYLGVISRIKNAFNALKSDPVSLNDDELLQWLGISKGMKNTSEITYFTCLKMLTETLAKMPIKYYQATDQGNIRANPDSSYYVLSKRPNKFMTPSTFWGAVELNRVHFGNAYVLVKRKDIRQGRYTVGQEVSELWLLKSNNTTVLIDNAGIFENKGDIYYQYTDEYSGEVYLYKSDDVMHFKSSYTFNGIIGKSVKEILKDSIEGALESQNFMNNLYKEGLTSSMALQYTGDLDDKKVNKLKEKYKKYFDDAKSTGKVIPVPIGVELKPLHISLVDAQFFELKKYSALQIAGAMGIKPNQINNYEKSSYSNSETQNLSFLVDTMLYIIKQYEEEINYKILDYNKAKEGFFFKFNEKALLRTDSKSQIECITKAVNNGLYSVNEGRGYLDLPAKEGGDILIVNGNYIPLTEVGKQYEKGENKNA